MMVKALIKYSAINWLYKVTLHDHSICHVIYSVLNTLQTRSILRESNIYAFFSFV